MSRTQSIHRRLLTDQAVLLLALGIALLVSTLFGARRAVEKVSQNVISRAVDQAEARLARFFDPLEASLAAVAAWGEAGSFSLAETAAFETLVQPVTERLGQIAGVLLADQDGNEQYLSRTAVGWSVRSAPPVEAGYDPRERSWFQGALAAPPEDPIHWTRPYLLFERKVEGMTASIAFNGVDGRRQVAAFDVVLSDLTEYARDIEVSEGGSLWVLTDDRRLLSWPDDPEIWQGRDPSQAFLRQPLDLDLPLVDDAVEILRGRDVEEFSAPVRFRSGGADWWTAAGGFDLSDRFRLISVVAVPHADLLGERARLRWLILVVTLVTLAAAVARAAILARRFSRPIEALARESERFSRGDFEPGKAVVSGLTEVQGLADAHQRMRRGLKTLLKLEDDLRLARQIQQETFPQEPPSLYGFDLVGWNRCADETGGDSYDVIGLSEEGKIVSGEARSLILMLADATGHGIGPALSVTQLRAMLRMAVRTGSDLASTAAQINEQLYADLPSNRFITGWLGRLELDGTLHTYSGGQAPILIYRSEIDEVEVENANGPPLGLLPPMPVHLPVPTKLGIGDIYVVLSDGFYEAADLTGVEFDTERVVEVVKRHHREPVERLLAALRAAVREFTADAPPSDDRTAVIVKRVL